MSSGLTDLTVGSSLTGATIWVEDGVVYYQAPSPLPPGASQDDFSIRGLSPSGEQVSDRCNIGLQSSAEGAEDLPQPTPPPPAPPELTAPEEPATGQDIQVPGTPETSAAPESSETPSAASTPTESQERFSGPPIPGMPDYSLPHPGLPGSAPSASDSPPSPDREAAEDSAPEGSAGQEEDSELAVTGLSTLHAVTAVVLALFAILAGAAAVFLAARRSHSPR